MVMEPDANDLSRQKLMAVFATQDAMEAQIVQGLLHAAGIESVVNSELPSSLFPLQMGQIALLEILVLESQAEQASQIISQQESDGQPEV